MRMQTVRGTSIIRPTRSMARPAVTAISSCEGPTHVHAVLFPPSAVVLPIAVFQTGCVEPLVNVPGPVRTCTLLLESTIAEGNVNGVCGRQPLLLIGPSLVQTMFAPSVTVAPTAAKA